VPGAERGSDRVDVAVVGAHLRGQPLNGQLVDVGAELVATTTTTGAYRLHRLAGGPPLRPGLERVGAGGRAIEVEVWSLPWDGLGRLVGSVAPPLGIGSVELASGRWVKGFICEGVGIAGADDITEHGGWRAYLSSSG
jgi:allophanate hydrolase